MQFTTAAGPEAGDSDGQLPALIGSPLTDQDRRRVGEPAAKRMYVMSATQTTFDLAGVRLRYRVGNTGLRGGRTVMEPRWTALLLLPSATEEATALLWHLPRPLRIGSAYVLAFQAGIRNKACMDQATAMWPRLKLADSCRIHACELCLSSIGRPTVRSTTFELASAAEHSPMPAHAWS